MNDLHTEAALIWAQAHAGRHDSPVEFGHKVALVYLTCLQTRHHTGDEASLVAALTALSVPPEVLQALCQLALHLPRRTEAGSYQPGSAGEKS